MQMFFILLTLASYVLLEVLSDGKLQEIADIAKRVDNNTTSICGYDCATEAMVDGTKLTVSFRTTIADGADTDALCKCMYDYMKDGVGDAMSECVEEKGNQFAIVFHGVYDPNAKKLPSLTAMANILKNYEKLVVNGYECTSTILERDGQIYITLAYIGEQYRTACAAVLQYLIENKLMDGVSSKCNEIDLSKKAELYLFATE